MNSAPLVFQHKNQEQEATHHVIVLLVFAIYDMSAFPLKLTIRQKSRLQNITHIMTYNINIIEQVLDHYRIRLHFEYMSIPNYPLSEYSHYTSNSARKKLIHTASLCISSINVTINICKISSWFDWMHRTASINGVFPFTSRSSNSFGTWFSCSACANIAWTCWISPIYKKHSSIKLINSIPFLHTQIASCSAIANLLCILI